MLARARYRVRRDGSRLVVEGAPGPTNLGEEIVRTLETGQAPLDESIALYAEGDRLKRRCEERLASAQAKIDKITLGPDGARTGTQPFDAG